jgi:hypothetical protein
LAIATCDEKRRLAVLVWKIHKLSTQEKRRRGVKSLNQNGSTLMKKEIHTLFTTKKTQKRVEGEGDGAYVVFEEERDDVVVTGLGSIMESSAAINVLPI